VRDFERTGDEIIGWMIDVAAGGHSAACRSSACPVPVGNRLQIKRRESMKHPSKAAVRRVRGRADHGGAEVIRAGQGSPSSWVLPCRLDCSFPLAFALGYAARFHGALFSRPLPAGWAFTSLGSRASRFWARCSRRRRRCGRIGCCCPTLAEVAAGFRLEASSVSREVWQAAAPMHELRVHRLGRSAMSQFRSSLRQLVLDLRMFLHPVTSLTSERRRAALVGCGSVIWRRLAPSRRAGRGRAHGAM